MNIVPFFNSRANRMLTGKLVDALETEFSLPLSMVERAKAKNIDELEDLGLLIDKLEEEIADRVQRLNDARLIQHAAARYGEALDAGAMPIAAE